MSRLRVLVLTAVVGAIALPSTALGAVRSGSGTDPGGDQPVAARDLTRPRTDGGRHLGASRLVLRTCPAPRCTASSSHPPS
ncbi:MAG TPA: hypothetical protein VGM33_12125 [Baekduia sp.]